MALLAGLAVVARMGARPVDPVELTRRCEESRPVWASYQEDIKGQVGAQPVARWRGRLEQVRQEAGSVLVTFRLESPWSDYEANVPVLLRDPMGHEYRQDAVDREDGARRYVFHLDAQSGASLLPWVEIHFPHTERRIALGAGGHWKDTQVTP
jgi:hypothetical protein